MPLASESYLLLRQLLVFLLLGNHVLHIIQLPVELFRI
jgi:hypothetical protein